MSIATDHYKADYEVRRAFGEAMANAVKEDGFPTTLHSWFVTYKGCERRPPYKVYSFTIRAFDRDGKASPEMMISHVTKDS